MIRAYDRILILEDGTVMPGYGFGAEETKVVEVVFNTSMVGYQEILSDPSYTDQAVVMTYPLIGNYGMNRDDYETDRPSISGFIVREYCEHPSNFRCTSTLDEVMKKWGIVGIEGVDTRKLTRIIRDEGTMRGVIADINTPVSEGIELIRHTPVPHDSVARVTSKKIWHAYSNKAADKAYRVALIDCGAKRNIVRSLTARGCDVTVFPFDTDVQRILDLKPHGIMVSNGPGDPQDVSPVIDTLRKLRGKCPIFGICLGNQMIALSYGAETYKLRFGHRGGNHPVKDLETGKIDITSQNHSYAVDEASLTDTGLIVTHRNILDDTVEGIACPQDKVMGIQYHPESCPGPEDSGYLFDRFIAMMEENKNA